MSFDFSDRRKLDKIYEGFNEETINNILQCSEDRRFKIESLETTLLWYKVENEKLKKQLEGLKIGLTVPSPLSDSHRLEILRVSMEGDK